MNHPILCWWICLRFSFLREFFWVQLGLGERTYMYTSSWRGKLTREASVSWRYRETPPLKPLNTIERSVMTPGIFRWCVLNWAYTGLPRETPVSRTAVRLISVVFPVWYIIRAVPTRPSFLPRGQTFFLPLWKPKNKIHPTFHQKKCTRDSGRTHQSYRNNVGGNKIHDLDRQKGDKKKSTSMHVIRDFHLHSFMSVGCIRCFRSRPHCKNPHSQLE